MGGKEEWYGIAPEKKSEQPPLLSQRVDPDNPAWKAVDEKMARLEQERLRLEGEQASKQEWNTQQAQKRDESEQAAKLARVKSDLQSEELLINAKRNADIRGEKFDEAKYKEGLNQEIDREFQESEKIRKAAGGTADDYASVKSMVVERRLETERQEETVALAERNAKLAGRPFDRDKYVEFMNLKVSERYEQAGEKADLGEIRSQVWDEQRTAEIRKFSDRAGLVPNGPEPIAADPRESSKGDREVSAGAQAGVGSGQEESKRGRRNQESGETGPRRPEPDRVGSDAEPGRAGRATASIEGMAGSMQAIISSITNPEALQGIADAARNMVQNVTEVAHAGADNKIPPSLSGVTDTGRNSGRT